VDSVEEVGALWHQIKKEEKGGKKIKMPFGRKK